MAAPTPRDGRFYRRLRLRRADGRVYLDRWGLSHIRIGGILLHRMSAPDPGLDLHDHPWTFVTIPLIGSYSEERADTRDAALFARIAENYTVSGFSPARRGHVGLVRQLRPRLMRLDECHRIVELHRKTVWTLVINGPRRRTWGFYLPDGWVSYRVYDKTVRAERRDVFAEGDRPR